MAEKKFDLSSIMAEYGDNDFGFTAIDEDEYNAVIVWWRSSHHTTVGGNKIQHAVEKHQNQTKTKNI
jgi:hypothetical protein